MPNNGDLRTVWKWETAAERKPLIGKWWRQRGNNNSIMGEALPAGGSLIAEVELIRPAGEVLGYCLHLYSSSQGWVGGEVGTEFLFRDFDYEGPRENSLSGDRIQPTGDPKIFYHRSSKTEAMMVKVGHSNVNGNFTRTYLWISAYEAIERFDGPSQSWQEARRI